MFLFLGGGVGFFFLLNINFKKKRHVIVGKQEKSVFMLKHVHVILRNVQKIFRLRGQYTEKLQHNSCASRLYRHLVYSVH